MYELIFSLLIPTAFFLIGFIRSSIDGKNPSGIIDLSDVNKKWSFDESWISRLTPVFSLLVIAYNVVIWALYSLISILDFFKFIITKIWWLVMWVWDEVLHPTLFFIFKLIWHYIVIFSWKFFKFSFSKEKQQEVYDKDNMLYSFKTMIQVFGLFIFLVIITNLFNFSPVSVMICALLMLVFIQYHIFESTNYFTNNSSSTNRKLKIIGSSLVISALFIGLLVLLRAYSHKIVIQGLGVTVAQISTPIIIVSSFIFIFSAFFLAPFINSSTDNSFSSLGFVKSTLVRIPKFIYSLPFHISGIVISSLLSIIVISVLSYGIESTTDLTIDQWQNVASDMKNHIPEIKKDKKRIVDLNNEIVVVDSVFKFEQQMLSEEISSKEIEIDAEIALRQLLVPNEIFSFNENAYVSEVQKFSFIEALNADKYEWEIIATKNDSSIFSSPVVKYQKNLNKEGIPNTYVFSYKWRKAGKYRIEVTPKNSCGPGSPSKFSRDVTVKDRPITKMAINSPSGRNNVCEGDTVTFLASRLDWMESWEWDIPNNYKIISNDNQQDIKVVWGSNPGTVRVRAHGLDVSEQMSVWSGLLVNVQPSVGVKSQEVSKIPDEKVSIFYPERPNYYYTVIEAENAISRVEAEKLDLEVKMKDLVNSHESKIIDLNNDISSLRATIKVIRVKIFGTIIGLIGFILFLSIAFTNLWTYFINYNYSIYNFEQEGSHYVNDQVTFYKTKNPNQPMLGWFVIIAIISIIALFMNYA
jgi:hypothetical protein